MMPTDIHPLVVVGASGRAMAASAVRAGFRVSAADLFGDHDLRAIAHDVATIRPYPDGLPVAIASFPQAPWLYTGALENHTDLLAAVAVCRPLAGSSPTAVARVRDPESLAAGVRSAGLLYPTTRPSATGLPRDGTWLVKPINSAGGRGIRPWYGEADCRLPAKALWQWRIAGRRVAAGYSLAAGRSRLVAASRQLVGKRWCRAEPFAYCGSVDLDPDALDASLRHRLVLLGHTLADRFGLIGLAGADLIVDSAGRVYVIEINPRPTASLELAERATGLSLASTHLAACGINSPIATEHWPRSGTWAKAILFAARDFVFGSASLKALYEHSSGWTTDDGWPSVADIPEPPCPIPAGAPVCTIFAHAPSRRGAILRLRHRVETVERIIPG